METAGNTARHFGVGKAFDNVEWMFREMPEIDVVCVSVRPLVHHKVVMAALRAGKQVCEQRWGSIDQAGYVDLARAKACARWRASQSL